MCGHHDAQVSAIAVKRDVYFVCQCGTPIFSKRLSSKEARKALVREEDHRKKKAVRIL
jgi:hypothetical protein